MNTLLILKNIGRYLLLMFLQIVVLNQIAVSNLMIPYIYVLFVIMLPTNTDRHLMLILAFLTGLGMDISCNIMGYHAFACTAVAMARILFADRIILRNEELSIQTPSIHSVNLQVFATYALFLLAIFYLFLFGIELFEIHGIWLTLLSIILSTAVSLAIVMLYQMIFIRKPHR